MKQRTLTIMVLALMLLLVIGVTSATHTPTRRFNTDQEIRDIFDQLVSVATSDLDVGWPPVFEIYESSEVNAYATIFLDAHDNRIGKVVIYRGLLDEVIQNDADGLAFVLGHELAHILLQHLEPQHDPMTVRRAISREYEFDADALGMELALKAGYSFAGVKRMVQYWIHEEITYSTWHALTATHPTWVDRMANLDEESGRLWQAMSTFSTGTFFLQSEQYYWAVRCFQNVREEFPEAYEAWYNEGYALLMLYLDTLEEAQIREMDLGLLATAVFYREPLSLQRQVLLLRLTPEEIWQMAVDALRNAKDRGAHPAMVEASLGLAYLTTPKELRSQYIGQAVQHFDRAGQVKDDGTLDILTQVSTLINAAVAQMDYGSDVQAGKLLAQAESLIAKTPHKSAQLLQAILQYNRSSLLQRSGSEKEMGEAVQLLEMALHSLNPASAWWPVGYERYSSLAGELGRPVVSAEDLIWLQVPNWRPAALEIKDLHLSVHVRVIEETLGPPPLAPVLEVPNTNIRTWRYPEADLQILGTNEVIAILLKGPKAPGIILKHSGIGAKEHRIWVGMPYKDLKDLLVEEFWDRRPLFHRNVYYDYYPDISLAVRQEMGTVKELAMVRIPDRFHGESGYLGPGTIPRLASFHFLVLSLGQL